jgi:hypothetical protein
MPSRVPAAAGREIGRIPLAENADAACEFDWTSCARQALLWLPAGGCEWPAKVRPRLAVCGALGGASAGIGPALEDGVAIMARTPKSKSKAAATTNPAKPASAPLTSRPGSKAAALIALLKAKRGATIAEMMEATGWQAHSVRGFLAGSLRTRHGLKVTSEKRDAEERRYRLS